MGNGPIMCMYLQWLPCVEHKTITEADANKSLIYFILKFQFKDYTLKLLLSYNSKSNTLILYFLYMKYYMILQGLYHSPLYKLGTLFSAQSLSFCRALGYVGRLKAQATQQLIDQSTLGSCIPLWNGLVETPPLWHLTIYN